MKSKTKEGGETSTMAQVVFCIAVADFGREMYLPVPFVPPSRLGRNGNRELESKGHRFSERIFNSPMLFGLSQSLVVNYDS